MHIPPRTAGVTAVKADTSFAARRILVPLQRFVHTETTGGIVLLVAAVAAIAWANSPFGASYERFWSLEVAFRVGQTAISHTLREWINDGLMTLFFFVVGLEIKRELVRGQLSGWQRASLPIVCAIGGMVVPALFYYGFNRGTPEVSGWGIPMATDIAFALGVLAVLGDRIPSSARIFLLALATVDDVGAILVIAIFYSEHVSHVALAFGLAVLGILLLMRVLGVQTVGYYLPWALMFWFAILESGIHPTIAGVVLGLLTPTGPYLARADFAALARPLVHTIGEIPSEGDGEKAEATLGQLERLTVATESPADRVVRVLHPWSSYLVLPVFALANAGVHLTAGVAEHVFWNPVFRGIFLGLVAGKVAGAFSRSSQLACVLRQDFPLQAGLKCVASGCWVALVSRLHCSSQTSRFQVLRSSAKPSSPYFSHPCLRAFLGMQYFTYQLDSQAPVWRKRRDCAAASNSILCWC
jgi:Na+:H+ antiporter, NhaA family